MFTTCCFIRKNTPELRKELEKLGYSPAQNGHGAWFISMNKLSYLETFNESSCYMGRAGYWDTSVIDCGTNEELFFALAALRDDTDRHQWFIDDNTGIWERSDDELPSRYMQIEGHKASVEEIIEHFTVEEGVE